MTILEKLVVATTARIENDKKVVSLNEMIERAEQVLLSPASFAFEEALKTSTMSFICEVKKASPSKGIISEEFRYLEIAKDYENAGATCLSVLTETDYFLGSDKYLEEISQTVSIPIIRKDFTVDPYQIYQAKAIGANAVLLICSLLDIGKIRNFIEICDNIGLSALVEAHDEQEIQKAIRAGARIIGVNNRNLKTFAVDLQNSIRLRKLVPNDILFVSESGISTRKDIEMLEKNNVNAVLIGETLMRSSNKKEALDRLRGNS